MLSNADGWAVGDITGTTFTILHWLGSSWSPTSVTASCNNQNLNGVSSVSSTEAWAVGARWRTTGNCSSNGTGQRYTILRWNGTTWSALAPPNIPDDSNNNQILNAIHVISTTGGAANIGFAVGNSGVILKYNGSTWTAETSPVTRNLFGVYVVSTLEAWAVGANGTILKWNGSSWSNFSSPVSDNLRGISMLDQNGSGTAQSGWAVGNSGTALRYNGASWSNVNTGSSRTLNAVSSFYNENDVWAAGNSGTLLHWDGSSWTDIESSLSVALTGISVVQTRPSPLAWQEIFP
jgi:hypothetical protein